MYRLHRARKAGIAALIFNVLAAAALAEDQTLDYDPKLGHQVVDYCREHVGQRVGDGECAALASAALRAAGAKSRAGSDYPHDGDYTWGELVYTLDRSGKQPKSIGRRADIRPGDVIQFRDAKWSGAVPGNRGKYIKAFPHHTAVIATIDRAGKSITIYQQNYAGNKTVIEDRLKLSDFKEGWIRVYRPIGQ